MDKLNLQKQISKDVDDRVSNAYSDAKYHIYNNNITDDDDEFYLNLTSSPEKSKLIKGRHRSER